MDSQDISQALLGLLYRISRELVMTLDLHEVLARLLTLSVQNIAAERGSIIVLDDHYLPIEAAIVYEDHVQPHRTDQLMDIVENGLAGWVIRNRQPALVENTSKDDRWLYHPDDSAERSGAKSAICVPIINREKLIGVLTIVHPIPGFFNSQRLELLQAIADQAGIAINNALLYRSLQALNRRYQALFEDSVDPIFITDPNGIILLANRQAANATRLDADQLVGKSLYEFLALEDDVLRSILSAEPADDIRPYETTLGNIGESAIPVEVYVRLIDIEGQRNFQWIMHNISERKSLDQLREDLGAMIYHDIRSPLSNIVTSLDMVEMMLPAQADPMLKSILAIVDRSVERVQRLISGLLDINRLEAGKPIVNRQRLSPADLIPDVEEAVALLAESKEQKIIKIIDDQLPEIDADAEMLKRVLINLVENALKYSPSGGQVVIKISRVDQMVRFSVEDSGPGIPPEARMIIFEKFTRLQEKQFPKGLGLGLAFCRLAVEGHGGKIWVEDAPGTGSSFVFTIPVHVDPPPPSE